MKPGFVEGASVGRAALALAPRMRTRSSLQTVCSLGGETGIRRKVPPSRARGSGLENENQFPGESRTLEAQMSLLTDKFVSNCQDNGSLGGIMGSLGPSALTALASARG